MWLGEALLAWMGEGGNLSRVGLGTVGSGRG